MARECLLIQKKRHCNGLLSGISPMLLSTSSYNVSYLRVKQINDICVARCVRYDLDVRCVLVPDVTIKAGEVGGVGAGG